MTNQEYIKQNNISFSQEYDAFFFNDIAAERIHFISKIMNFNFSDYTKRGASFVCDMCFGDWEHIFRQWWLNETYDGWTIESIENKKQSWLSKFN